jgi:uncharacterized membrane protein
MEEQNQWWIIFVNVVVIIIFEIILAIGFDSNPIKDSDTPIPEFLMIFLLIITLLMIGLISYIFWRGDKI